MNETPLTLPDPEITRRDALLLVGLKKRYLDATSAGIPAQWQAFQPHIDAIENRTGEAAYGVLIDWGDAADYFTGVEVTRLPDSPDALTSLRIAPQTYAMFRHEGHVSEIRRTWAAIFGTWFPASGHAPADAPKIECYDAGFDPQTGRGGIGIWIPIRD